MTVIYRSSAQYIDLKLITICIHDVFLRVDDATSLINAYTVIVIIIII